MFDGGHTVAGAWEAVRNALPDDHLNEEALGFLAAYWKDLVTPMGMPIANFSRDSFDQVTAAASRIGIEPEWLKDLVSFTATEGAGALAAVVGAALSWHKNDIEDFAEYAASIAAVTACRKPSQFNNCHLAFSSKLACWPKAHDH